MKLLPLAIIALLLSAGCASQPAPIAPGGDEAAEEAVSLAGAPLALVPASGPAEIHDPWGRYNRSMYRFNAHFDEAIHWPVASGYQRVVPRPARRGISNFFSNLGEIRNTANHLLQGRPRYSFRTGSRLLINSTLGLAGLFDVADRMGIPPRPTSFGNTLGRWGVGPGPYLVLPVAGPSSLRDSVGLLADLGLNRSINPAGIYTGDTALPLGTLFVIDTRAQLSFRYFQSGSPFEYELIRFLYTQKRAIEIDGARTLPQIPRASPQEADAEAPAD